MNDWKNCADILKNHECSPEHNRHMASWKDLEFRLEKRQTIDQVQMRCLEDERNRWREVLKRLVAIIQSLAERNMGLRGTTDALYDPNNGNFHLYVLKHHIGLIQSGASHTTYLGNIIQNELIECIGKIIIETMAIEIKEVKYFSIIVDSTPDISHIEQVSLIVRTVTVHNVAIREHFMGFLCRVKSVEAVRYQAAEVRDALLEVTQLLKLRHTL